MESYPQIESLHIQNYKSLVDVSLEKPSPFSVFVGANGSGKSNLFGALEFLFYAQRFPDNDTILQFGGKERLLHLNYPDSPLSISLDFDDNTQYLANYHNDQLDTAHTTGSKLAPDFKNSFSRVVFQAHSPSGSADRFNTANSNLATLLKPVLEDEEYKGYILNFIQTYVPEIEEIAISEDRNGKGPQLLVYEKFIKGPLTEDLISTGTYNILRILGGVYQTKTPQFLCIEEPENSLHPKALKDLACFFRELAQEHGYYIWIKTHSPYFLSVLRPEELVLVDKEQSQTQLTFIKDDEFVINAYNAGDITMDEAWLTNYLEGGLPW